MNGKTLTLKQTKPNKQSECLNICYYNIQCLRNKINNVEIIANQSNFDVICLTESWLQNDEVEIFNVVNFNIASFYCRTLSNHGGVIIYLKRNIKFRTVNYFDFLCEEKHFECAAVQLTNENILIVTIYRSPNGDTNIFFRKIYCMLEIIQNMNSKVVLNGDFNIHINNAALKETKQFFDVIHSFNLKFGVSAPTRVTKIRGKTSQSCIDNVITNIDYSNISINVTDLHLSDHFGIQTKIKVLNSNTTKIRKMRIISEKNLKSFKSDLSNFDWTFLQNIQNANELFTCFFKILSEKFKYHFPEKNMKQNGNIAIKWFNDDLKQMRNLLEIVSIIRKNTESEDVNNLYRILKQDYRKNIQHAKKAANRNFIESSTNKSRATWQLINSQLKKENNTHFDISPENFNNFFVNIADNIIKDVPQSNEIGRAHV